MEKAAGFGAPKTGCPAVAAPVLLAGCRGPRACV